MRRLYAGRSARVLALIGLSFGGSAALAGTITIRDGVGGQNAGYYVDPTNSQTSATFDGGGFSAHATGMLDLEADYNDGNGFVPLDTYCMNPLNGLGFGTQPGDTVGIAGYIELALRSLPEITDLEGDYIEILWSNAFADSALDPNAAVKAGAFQAILWELFLDDGLTVAGLSSGNFRLNVANGFTLNVFNQAAAYIGLITGGTWNDGVDLLVLDHPTSQDFLKVVPEPATLGLVATGALALLRRRR